MSSVIHSSAYGYYTSNSNEISSCAVQPQTSGTSFSKYKMVPSNLPLQRGDSQVWNSDRDRMTANPNKLEITSTQQCCRETQK